MTQEGKKDNEEKDWRRHTSKERQKRKMSKKMRKREKRRGKHHRQLKSNSEISNGKFSPLNSSI